MDNVKMVLTLFIFCFVAAFLLAYVDKQTYPIITKFKAQKEAEAKKEVLLMKNGGVNLSSFPEGKYSVKEGKSEAIFIIKNSEIRFEKLILNGIDYLAFDKKYSTKKGDISTPGPISILVRSFSEKRVIDNGRIKGQKRDIEIARKFLKSHPNFISSLIKIILSPVSYKEKDVIYLKIGERNYPVFLPKKGNEIEVMGKKIVIKKEEDIVKLVKIGDEIVKPNGEYKLGKDILKVNSSNEYKIHRYFDAYYGGKKYIGTVFKIAPICFADKVVTIVGVMPDGRVSGIKVLSQAETPGLGARIMEIKKGEKEPWWQSEFHGLSLNELYLKVKDAKVGKIDAITAATITPRRLTKGIRKAVSDYLAFRKMEKEVR